MRNPITVFQTKTKFSVLYYNTFYEIGTRSAVLVMISGGHH